MKKVNKEENTQPEVFKYSATQMRQHFLEYMEPYVNEFVEKHIVPAAKQGKMSVRIYMDNIKPSSSEYIFRANVETVLSSEKYGFSIDSRIAFHHRDHQNDFEYTEVSWWNK